MRAIRIVNIGAPLEERKLPDPVPGPGEIVVAVAAAGICHSDAHYRDGTSPVGTLPITPGHEVAGTIVDIGPEVVERKVGERVALHYLITCGRCNHCVSGDEQFCPTASMIGKHTNGGYAQYIVVPARNAVPVPDEVDFETAAIMMCSSATSFHALRRARLTAGESVAVLGAGGLGMSAIQLARICGASQVFAVDIDPTKLAQAEGYGAIAVDGSDGNAVKKVTELTGGSGVDITVEVAGLPVTQEQAVAMLAVHGRAVLAGITDRSFNVASYDTLLNKESEVLGVSDHLRGELSTLMEFARRGLFEPGRLVSRRVELDAVAVNRVLDDLAEFHGSTRTIIVPT